MYLHNFFVFQSEMSVEFHRAIKNLIAFCASMIRLFHIFILEINFQFQSMAIAITFFMRFVVRRRFSNSFFLRRGRTWLLSYFDSYLEKRIVTLHCISLRRCCFGLETRVIIKILTHSCYSINLD